MVDNRHLATLILLGAIFVAIIIWSTGRQAHRRCHRQLVVRQLGRERLTARRTVLSSALRRPSTSTSTRRARVAATAALLTSHGRRFVPQHVLSARHQEDL